MKNCIWGILTMDNFEFIHVSKQNDKIIGISLFDLIHPEEVLLAKRDLRKFIHTKKRGGSVTRCRIMDYNKEKEWIVIDVIIYIATKNLLLCFLHNPNKTYCMDEELLPMELPLNEMSRTSSPALSSASSTSTNSSDIEYENSYHQYFQIINNQKNTILYTSHHEHTSIIENKDQSSQSCFNCIQLLPKISSTGQKMETLVINYGKISFHLVYVDNNFNKHPKPSQTTMQLSNKQQQYCHSCGTRSSPEWRKGPTGHKTLCNACGLRYSRLVARLNQQQKQNNLFLFQSQNTPHGKRLIYK